MRSEEVIVESFFLYFSFGKDLTACVAGKFCTILTENLKGATKLKIRHCNSTCGWCEVQGNTWFGRKVFGSYLSS